jgi:hypothetical protein
VSHEFDPWCNLCRDRHTGKCSSRVISSTPTPDKQQFATGAVRDTTDGKVRMDLLPWQELERVAWHYTRGAEKYAERNWEKGIPSSRCLQSLLRHVVSLVLGRKDEDHLSAIVFNCLAIAWNQRVFKDDPGINDLPGWEPDHK